MLSAPTSTEEYFKQQGRTCLEKDFEEDLEQLNKKYEDALRRLATNDFLDKVEINDNMSNKHFTE